MPENSKCLKVESFNCLKVYCAIYLGLSQEKKSHRWYRILEKTKKKPVCIKYDILDNKGFSDWWQNNYYYYHYVNQCKNAQI